MQKEILHYNIRIKGCVQGVGFRHEARTVARYYGLTGIVKNLPDGSVYLEAEGSREDLDLLFHWCKKGPGYGYVESVTIETGKLKGYSTFQVVL